MSGARILYTIPILGGIPITETIVIMWGLILVLALIGAWLGHGLTTAGSGSRQNIAETIVGVLYGWAEEVTSNTRLAPFIGCLFALSITGSLTGLFSLRPVTADLSVVLAWALLCFVLIQVFRIRDRGFGGWLHSFAEPFWAITPLNLISEIATPVSMSFRHFGNIAAGMVITKLVYDALAALSFSFLPLPLFQIGIPAALSIYFDLFTGFLQAYIFCMLTMVYTT